METLNKTDNQTVKNGQKNYAKIDRKMTCKSRKIEIKKGEKLKKGQNPNFYR